MSLFGSSPPGDSPSFGGDSTVAKSRASLFDDGDDSNGALTRSTSDGLFDDDATGSPWDMPTPRKQQSRADLLRALLAGVEVPDSYIEAFDSAVAEDGAGGKVTPDGISRILAAADLSVDDRARITAVLAPSGEEAPLGRNEFNVFLALVGLAQEGETISLDGVDERRRSRSTLFSTSVLFL
jgi:sorting nexin-8